MGEFVTVTAASEIPENQGKVCEVRGKEIAFFNVGGTFCAIANSCPHRGGPLGEGALEAGIVTCPWHGWEFDVRTGVSPVNPAASIQKFNCRVERGELLVEVD